MLYQRYERRVYGLVVTLVGRGPAADDAFQDAMWELWRRASTFDGRLGSATSWILMLARSRAIDVARRRSRVNKLQGALEQRARGTADFGAAALTGGSVGSGAGSALDAEAADLKTLGARAMRLVGELPKEQQVVVRMAFMQGMTREEIASALSVPVGTVKTRLRTAVRVLGGQMAAGTGTAGAETTELSREENGN
ncbi:MAG: RNA polymerase sigma factor [Phycisphaerales bacterium]